MKGDDGKSQNTKRHICTKFPRHS